MVRTQLTPIIRSARSIGISLGAPALVVSRAVEDGMNCCPVAEV